MTRVVGFIPVPLPVPDVVQLLETYAEVWEFCTISSPQGTEIIQVHPEHEGGGQTHYTTLGMLITVEES